MRAAAALFAAVVFASAGCASSQEPAPTSQSRTTTAAAGTTTMAGGYAGGFDAVTQGFRARSEDLQARVDTSTTDLTKIVTFYRELRDIAARARVDYGALAPPAAVQSVHQRILQLFDRQVALLDQVIEAAEADDQTALANAVQGLVDLTSDFDQARRQMEQAIRACGAPCTT
ncbi:MAG TPA: hypothetical protein VGA36_09200 [Nitriliruptorales bacterium]